MTQVDNPFSVITNRKYPDDFMIKSSTFTQQKNNERKLNEPIRVDVYISPKKAKKTHNSTVIGVSVATFTLISAGIVFMLLGGGTRGLLKNLDKLSNKINKKVNSYNINTDGVTSISNYLIVSIGKLVENVSSKIEFINNFTTFKDILFTKLMNNKLTGPVTGKVHQSITSLYEKLAKTTLLSSYKKTKSVLYDAFGYSDSLRNKKWSDLSKAFDIKGVSKTKKEILEDIHVNENIISTIYNDIFDNEVEVRHKNYKKILSTIAERFSNIKDTFLNHDVYKKFLSETEFSTDREKIINEVMTSRKSISYSITDLHNLVDEILDKILIKTKINDKNTLKAINKTKLDLQTKLKNENLNKNIIRKSIEKLKEKLNTKDDQEIIEFLNKAIENCDNYVPGEIEYILDLYQKILSKDEFNIIKSKYYKAVKSLDKSINLETQEYSSKLRDLALGSAPTDVLTIVGGVASLGYGLGVADNKQERTSISLKYGIPAIIGIITNLYCSARLYAGTKGLFFGVVSSLMANKIGAYVDQKYNINNDKVSKNTLKNV